MFEQSLLVSRETEVPARVRWTAVGSMVAQSGLVALMAALPLLHPEGLLMRDRAPRVMLPPIVRPVVPVARMERALAGAAPAMARMVTQVLLAPSTIPHGIKDGPPAMAETAMVAFGESMGDAANLAATMSVGTDRAAGRVGVVAEAKKGPTRVSAGVSQGMLLEPIRPVYPEMARATRVQGAVVIAATISKSGRIESARVVSGPAMLRSAALEAVERARYRPYQLNGELTAVETVITVNFRMGS